MPLKFKWFNQRQAKYGLYGCLFSAIFLLQSHTKVIINASRRFLVGCSDCRFLVLYIVQAIRIGIPKERFVVSSLYYHDSCFKSAKTLALSNKLFHVHLIDWVIGFQMTGIFADNNFKSFLKVDLFTLKIWGHQWLVWDTLIVDLYLTDRDRSGILLVLLTCARMLRSTIYGPTFHIRKECFDCDGGIRLRSKIMYFGCM